jgi:hypothetical protein
MSVDYYWPGGNSSCSCCWRCGLIAWAN